MDVCSTRSSFFFKVKTLRPSQGLKQNCLQVLAEVSSLVRLALVWLTLVKEQALANKPINT